MIEWVLEALTVNQKYHMDDLTKLWENVRKERPELWEKK
jgi:hypothetical protein